MIVDYSKTVYWLLSSDDPSIRYLTLRDILGFPENSPESVSAKKLILRGPKVSVLLSGQQSDGGFSVHPYRKWSGAHWRIVSLVNLAIPKENTQILMAAEQVLRWLYQVAKKRLFSIINGLPRMHASVHGNPLGVLSYLGMAHDPRVRYIAELIMEFQWPDGGWNCDTNPNASHSSFHESLATLWDLIEYRRSVAGKEVDRSIDKACELFLSHRIFRSHRTGKIIKSEWLKLRYPVYWHYNFLEAMRILSLAGKAKDPRMSEALDLLQSKCNSSGQWEVEGCYWRPPINTAGQESKTRPSQEVVDWGRKGPNEMITLNALRVLKAAGRAMSLSNSVTQE